MNAIDKEVCVSKPIRYRILALDLLKTMVYIWKKEKKENKFLIEVKNHYQKKLIEILEDTNTTWQHQKLYAKQIIDTITTEEERYHIFWNAWKNCAGKILDDDEFQMFTRYFINDLINSSTSFKNLIVQEIFDLIGSENIQVSSRAKDLYSRF